jgi:hypothetical protein
MVAAIAKLCANIHVASELLKLLELLSYLAD